jgi:hypothetical protein
MFQTVLHPRGGTDGRSSRAGFLVPQYRHELVIGEHVMRELTPRFIPQGGSRTSRA